MKKFVLSLGLGLTLAANVFAADNSVDELNAGIENILAPFQNAVTVGKLHFDTLDLNEERVASVAVNGLYRKLGSKNTLEFKIDNLSYSYGDGLSPTVIFKGSLGLDITKLMDQETLNQIIPNAAVMVEGIAKDYSEYGDAATVKGVVTSTGKDSEGNYTSLTALLSAKIDLAKLPESKEAKYVLATDAVLSISLDLKTGFKIDAYVVSNPGFIGFQTDEEGLKELLEKLLASDEEELRRIKYNFEGFDAMAARIVNDGVQWARNALLPH